MGVRLRDNSDRCVEAIVAATLDGLNDCGVLAQEEAKALVPVDTGRLRDSIRFDVAEEGTYATMMLAADTEYATHVELGTRKMPPRPYLRPAVVNHTDEMTSLIASAISEALR